MRRLGGRFAGDHDEVAVGETGGRDGGRLRKLTAIVTEILFTCGDGEFGLDEEGERGNGGSRRYFDGRDCSGIANYG